MKKVKVLDIVFRRWLIFPYLAFITFLLTEILSYYPEVTEVVYSSSIYPVIAGLLSRISAISPISIDDLLYVFLILSGISLIVLLILKRLSFKKTGKIILNVIAVFYFLFYWLWGFNYFRSDINTRLQISESVVNENEYSSVLSSLIINTNESYVTFDDFSFKEINSRIEDSYKSMAPFLGLKYPMGERRAKNITFSKFFASATISGYFGPFFNEVHVNRFLLPVEYPMVLAHEKAHQFGITSEAEANFYAWIVCSQSDDKQVQYSAGLYILKYFLLQGSNLENYKELVEQIDDNVRNDFRKISKHWMDLRNEKIDHAAMKVNNAYLKTNKIKKGIKDYRGVVRLVMDYSSDENAQERVITLNKN